MDDKGIESADSDRGEEGATSALKQFAGASLPLEVGSIALGDDGQLRLSQDDRPLHFRFSACGILFEADIADKAAPLRLRANLGKLPFSAESPDARQLARTVISASGQLNRGTLVLSPEHDIVLEGELAPPSPRTPVSVIATALALILDFKPYLDLLGEAVALRRPPPQPPQEEAGDEPEPAGA